MRALPASLLCLLAAPASAADARAAFLLELAGVPVGTVELRLEDGGARYRYTSVHLFTREDARHQRTRSAAFDLAAQEAPPESLRLWRGPHAPGCVGVRSELEGKRGELCFTARRDGALEGTLHGAPFRGELDAAGELQLLDLGPARLRRVGRAEIPPPPDLFSGGWPITGEDGVLALEPPSPAVRLKELQPSPDVASARAPALSREVQNGLQLWPDAASAHALSRAVHASFPDKGPSAADFTPDEAAKVASCLGHARRFLARAKKRGFEAELVQGLHAEPGAARAHPHAWVRIRTPRGPLELDPTLLEEVTPATHLALPGTAWPELLSGTRSVRRRSAM